ncbi:ABC transporter substrate-binding protein [Halobacteriovorax sp. RT-1-4]|uniref:ABC transporter substrate-binding protein n=1 Tax=unclassified Halobacteriovorax TaxID=2639665 RepID=UPI00399A1686
MRIFILVFSAILFFNSYAQNFRVLSTLPSFTESMFYLDAGKLLVGVSDYCNFPEEAKRLPRYGSSFEINLEKVVEDKITSVLLAEVQGGRVKNNLEKLGVDVIITPYKKLDDAVGMLKVFNEKFKLNKDKKIEAFSNELKSLLKPISKGKRVLMIIDEKFKDGKLHEVRAIGIDNYYHEILTKLGAKNIVAESGYPLRSLESLLTSNFDLILRISDRKIKSEQDWKNSYFKDKIYLYEKDYAVVLGPRTLSLVKDLREILK